MLKTTTETFNKYRILQLLDKLDSTSEHSITIYLPCKSSPSDIQQALKIIPENEQILPALSKELENSPNGEVLFWGENNKFLVTPPFPFSEKAILYGYETSALRNLLERELTIAVVLIRLGTYGIGVFKGEELLASKVGTGLVHSRHSKGGSSANRFARHREKQIEYFFTHVCVRAREKLEPYLKQIDFLFYGGESRTVREFTRQCEFMSLLKKKVADRLLNIREPKQKTLLESINLVWSSKVIQWKQESETAPGL
jgi:peptide subunit release factor 1 (eRF1)